MSDTPIHDLIFEICEENGAIHDVDSRLYDSFIALSDEQMVQIITCIICDNAREIYRITQDKAKTELERDEQIERFIKTNLYFYSRGILVINRDGHLELMRPVGPPPNKEIQKKMDEKIENSGELMIRSLKQLPPSFLNN